VWRYIVLVLDFGPANALGREEIVAALALLYRSYTFSPIVAKESMKDAIAVEARYDQAPHVRDEGYP